jgi:hypothetical protein
MLPSQQPTMPVIGLVSIQAGTCSSCRTLIPVTYTQRLLHQIPPPTIRMFVCLSIIAAAGIIGLALLTFSHDQDVLRRNAQAVQHAEHDKLK